MFTLKAKYFQMTSKSSRRFHNCLNISRKSKNFPAGFKKNIWISPYEFKIFQTVAKLFQYFQMISRLSRRFQNCPDFSEGLKTFQTVSKRFQHFQTISKLYGRFQNSRDIYKWSQTLQAYNFKNVRIIPDHFKIF